jgi:hypothetical protein
VCIDFIHLFTSSGLWAIKAMLSDRTIGSLLGISKSLRMSSFARVTQLKQTDAPMAEFPGGIRKSDPTGRLVERDECKLRGRPLQMLVPY